MRSTRFGSPVSERRGDQGSAVAEFALISSMLAIVFLAVLQIALGFHVRNTLTDSAAAGARHAALGDRSLADGEQRAAELVRAALGEGYAADVHATAIRVNEVELIQVTINAPLPVFGLLGPSGTLEMRARALPEEL